MNIDLNAHHRRLCRLVDDSLLRFTDLAPTSLTPEITKDLLISLSQVHTRIRSWIVESDADSCSSDSEPPLIDDYINSSHHGHQCMTSILGHLVPLFSLPNQHIQHLTSKTLVTFFECDIAFENGGKEFLDYVCCCLKILITKAWSVTMGNFPTQAPMSSFEASQLSLKLKLESVNSVTLASILGVLRNMLKVLQLNDNGEVLKVYIDSVANSVSSWFLAIEACGVSNRNGSVGCDDHGLVYRKANQEKAVIILQGTILQILCSLIDASSSICDEAGYCKNSFIYKIRDSIPKLLALYLDKPENVGDAPISEYLRHKILILMLRLTSACHLENSLLVSWLHLISEYFNDLLLQPIETPKSDSNTYLEDSPFRTDFSKQEARRTSSRHLQRLTVFLFLRCSLTSLSMEDKADKNIEPWVLCKSSSSDFNWNIEFPPGTKGLFELQKWLRSHLPAIDANDPLYFNRCSEFASRFLQLFIHEDDLLFQMLLQTLCLPISLRQGDGVTSLAAKNDIYCPVSDIFNPINLFHLFLAEIFYDHQVILDYLISNDTGARCAEYLLKCLRVVCDAWDLFVDFPAFFESLQQPPCRKRRKVLESDMDLKDSCSVSDIRDNSSMPPRLHGQSKKGHKPGRKHGEATIVSLGDAKDCLQSLKASISSLHKKKLFPYNPQVLLRRLSKFEEACVKKTDKHVILKD